METTDLDAVHRWLNNPEVMPYWQGRDIPRSMEWVRDHYTPSIEGTSNTRRFIIESNDGEADGGPIGYVQGTRHPGEDGVARVAELDIMIGEPPYWSHGYGTDVVRTFLGHLFHDWKAHRVFLVPLAYNTRAISCYERAGFKQEGTLRDAEYVEGQWCDAIMMSILEQEFRDTQAG
jgi:aminoglycoside 6'-N-acetyltransferase